MKKRKKIKEILFPISEEEIPDLEKAIEGNYFDFEYDNVELYENYIIDTEQLKTAKNNININEDFYKNMPIENIKAIKKLLIDIKTLNHNPINYVFIKNKV